MTFTPRRFVGSRLVSDGQAEVLAAMPIFYGEKVEHMRMNLYACTRDATSRSDQPEHIAWRMLWIPYSIYLAEGLQASGNFGDPILGNTPDPSLNETNLNAGTDFDDLFARLVFDRRGTGQGDTYWMKYESGASGQTQKQEPSAPTDTDDTRSESISDDPWNLMGPQGPHMLYSRDVIMAIGTVESGNLIRWVDGVRDVTLSGPKGPGVILFGACKYDFSDSDTNFALEMNDDDVTYSQYLLMTGQIQEAQRIMATTNGHAGKWMRSVIFGGDSYYPADSWKTTDTRAYCTIEAWVDTPYHQLPAV